MRSRGPWIASARCDADDRIIEAQEPLATLQRRSGGEIPGKIATPALLELVRQARRRGARLNQMIETQDEQERITAWIEVEPILDQEGACRISIANWQTAPLAADDVGRAGAVSRNLAELTALLDAHQNILAAEATTPELDGIALSMREGVGKPWTDFVEIAGSHHHQPMHWRLLDGAKVKLEGSEREWTAWLHPLGGAELGRNGFELLVVATQPAATGEVLQSEDRVAVNVTGAAIGREIAPVLRQPIGRIVANASTIRSRLAGPLAEEYSNYAADIVAAGEHLLGLIEDLAELEAVDSDEFNIALDFIDLTELSHRAAGILASRAEEREIQIDKPSDGERMPALGETRRVLQILLNILGNAIRYSPVGSRIEIRLSRSGDTARVTIADQGEGLGKVEQTAIFEKYERLGRDGDGGTGLGLYISRKLARAMRGELSVESSPGKGASFTLSLPAGD